MAKREQDRHADGQEASLEPGLQLTEGIEAIDVTDWAIPGGAGGAGGADGADARAVTLDGAREYAKSPPTAAEKRADGLLAERALAELSVEAAKKAARAVAVEKYDAAEKRASVSPQTLQAERALVGLSAGAAKKAARAQAVEEYQSPSPAHE